MKKQDIIKYITIFIIIAFIGETLIIAFGSRSTDQEIATPTPTAVARVFSGTGNAAIHLVKQTGQYFIECNATDAMVLSKLQNINGVESAITEQQNLLFTTTSPENDTDAVGAVASLLEKSCDGYLLYRIGYVLPNAPVQLTGMYSNSNNTTTLFVSNYSLLSFAQLRSMTGVQAMLDYRTTTNTTDAVATFTVETINGIVRKATAKQLITTAQSSFSGSGMVMGTVSQVVPRLLVRCAPDGNYTTENITFALDKLNYTYFADHTATDLYVLDYNASVASANQTAEKVKAALAFCKPAAQVFSLGLVTPQNGSTCEKIVTYVYNESTEFDGTTDNGKECRGITFQKLLTYAAEQGVNGIITALDVNTAINKTVQARVTAGIVNGRVVNAIAQEG